MTGKTYWFERVYELRDKLFHSRDEITLYRDEIKLLLQILHAGEGDLYPSRAEVEAQLSPLVRAGMAGSTAADPTEPAGKQTMTVKEVSGYFGVSTSKIGELVRMQAIPHFRIGSRILFRRVDLDEWIKSQNQLRTSYGGDKK